MHEGPVDEVAQKELVAAGDRSRKVTEGQCRRMFFSVFPAVCAGDNDGDNVQNEGNSEVLCLM